MNMETTTMMDAIRRGWMLVGVAFVLAAPSVSSACAVCSAGKDEENAAAFLLSTVFMSLTPLIVIGTLVYVLYRRIQKLEAESATSESSEARLPKTAPTR